MTTFTLNRNMDAADCLFVALNDNIYADWRESQTIDTRYEDTHVTRKSFAQKVLEYFGR